MTADPGSSREPPPTLQLIVLGAGGGPQESNTTAFLIRPLSSEWRKGSVVAVDAGVHVSSIQRILESTQPAGLGKDVAVPHTMTTGPFAGLQLPYAKPAANAAHIAQNLVDTYLITHPHLDHIAGFVINTAGLPGTRPKRLAGLPSTINAFKTHIFNNVIWPNLSDENNGAGLVTYLRLVEGGSSVLGGDGYLEVSDGLAVKTWSVSHGHCIERHSHRGSTTSQVSSSHRGSTVSRYGSFDAWSNPMSMPGHMPMPIPSPRGFPFHPSIVRTSSIGPSSHAGCDGGTTTGGSVCGGQSACVYDSCAYFIRDVTSSKEVLIFGDVEPDSISLSPRNFQVWQDAAPKVASGALAAILIECSYDDSRPDDRLFGHLVPRYVMEELKALAALVEAVRRNSTSSTPSTSTSVAVPVGYAYNGLGSVGNIAHAHGSLAALSRKKRKRGVADMDENAIRRARHPSMGPLGNDELPLSPKSQMKAAPPAPTSNSRSASGNSLNQYLSVVDGSRRGSVTSSHISNGGGSGSDFGFDGIAPHQSTNIPGGGGGMDNDVGLPGQDRTVPPDTLKGLKVVIIHVKDRQDDQRPVGEVILEELLEHETEAKLGCEFLISHAGQSVYL